jgi:hypothetical protein
MMLVPRVLSRSEDDHKVLAALLMRRTGSERIKAHNFWVGHDREAAFMQQHGRRVMDLAWPLPPAMNGMAAVTQKLLTETAGVRGAGREFTPSVYRQPGHQDAANTDVLGGDYYAPILTNQQGESAVNLSDLEAFLAQLRTEVSRVANEVHRLRQGNNNSNHNGNGGRGRGGRGRGRNWHQQYPRGGETEAAAPTAAPTPQAPVLSQLQQITQHQQQRQTRNF